MSPAPRDAMAHARTFAAAIFDARLRAERAQWTPWVAHAQREAAPLVRAVRVLAARSLALADGPATATNGPAENGPGVSTGNGHTNGHECVTRSGDAPMRQGDAGAVTRSGELAARASRGPRIGRPSAPGESPRGDAGQVRGVLAERVIVSTALDPFLSLKALAAYSGLSVRTLREHLGDPAHPLPCYRVGGKVLVRRSDYDAWALRHRQVGTVDVDRLVDEVLRELR